MLQALQIYHLSTLLLFVVLLAAGKGKTSISLTQQMVVSHLEATQDPACREVSTQKPRIVSFETADFDKDGQNEAIVVAFTCMGGTGGPDVHAVYRLDDKGRLKDVPLPRLDEKTLASFPKSGNRNYRLKTSKDQLVAEYYFQNSTRTIHVFYTWRGDGFKFSETKIQN